VQQLFDIRGSCDKLEREPDGWAGAESVANEQAWVKRERGAGHRARTLGLWLSVVCAVGACRSRDAASEDTPPASAGTAPAHPAGALPELELRDETPNLLLTWVDEAGEFHVTEKILDVPEAGKPRVRVVLTDREVGTGALVYVANLSAKQADGSYPVDVWPRNRWDEHGAERRKQRMETFAQTADQNAAGGRAATAPLSAVIYGADWCKPCHDAEKLLHSLGVPVTMKNIESNRAAADEMRQKLERANRGGASIPVIDLAGELMVGFNPVVLRQKVERLRGRLTSP
jgi:glutaredoxin